VGRGDGFSVDSVCHLRDRPGLAIQRAGAAEPTVERVARGTIC
jgi:hypothetical protein